jgi:polynucleotide 5'-kinase involved in rRNA processing
MTSIDVPASWHNLDLTAMAGTVVVIGETDTGKSTFTYWLVRQLCQYHDCVAWLDADMGQSMLHLPTTMNVAVVTEPPAEIPSPAATFFVGDTSPRGHMLPTVVGARKLQAHAQAQDASAIVADTTGLVTGSYGAAFKHWEIAALEAGTIVAIQRHGELVDVLTPLVRDARRTVHVLSVSDSTVHRSADERAERRRRQFVGYFAHAAPLTFDSDRLAIYDLHRARRGRLLAFQNAGGFTLALGVIDAVSRREMTVLTPLRDLRDVVSLRVGNLAVDPETGIENRR